MKSLKTMLPTLGLVLGATMAMAMNFADNPIERYAEDPAPGTEIWYDLTDLEPGGTTYNCNFNPSVTCSREMPSSLSDQEESGVFVINGSLPIVP